MDGIGHSQVSSWWFQAVVGWAVLQEAESVVELVDQAREDPRVG